MTISVESAVRGGTYIWGAPTFDQVRVGFDETKRAAGGIADFNQSRMTVTFPSGGKIVYRSLDNPDNARGHTANGVVIDECGNVRPEAWHEVLRPMLIDTDGWAWGIGTPRGRNWFWQEHQHALDRDDTMAWQVPTLGVAVVDGKLERRPHPLENPHIPYAEIERMHQTLSEMIFSQEILAQFIDLQGGVFRGVMQATTATEQSGRITGHDYVIGVDWGKHNDFTVLAVVDMQTNELCYLDRFNQIDYAVQTSRLKALASRFQPVTVIAESNAMGEPIIEQLQRDGLPVQAFKTTNATKTAVIDALAMAFEQGAIRILNDPVLVGELQAYEMERLPSGMLRYSAPDGMHDDTVIGLALAWSGVSNTPWLLW